MIALLASISEGDHGDTKIDAAWVHIVPDGYDVSKGPYGQDPENEPGFSVGSNQTIVVNGHPLWELCVDYYNEEGEG